MSEVTIPVSPALLAPIHDLVGSVVRSMGGDLALNETHGSGDADLDAAWESSLVEGLQEDCLHLESMLRASDDGHGQLRIPLEQGEAIVRAASAVRLRLRQTLLRNVDDLALERGEVDLQELATLEQRGYTGYVFLANLQEVIVRFLDPAASSDIPEEVEDPYDFETDADEPGDPEDADEDFDGKNWG